MIKNLLIKILSMITDSKKFIDNKWCLFSSFSFFTFSSSTSTIVLRKIKKMKKKKKKRRKEENINERKKKVRSFLFDPTLYLKKTKQNRKNIFFHLPFYLFETLILQFSICTPSNGQLTQLIFHSNFCFYTLVDRA